MVEPQRWSQPLVASDDDVTDRVTATWRATGQPSQLAVLMMIAQEGWDDDASQAPLGLGTTFFTGQAQTQAQTQAQIHCLSLREEESRDCDGSSTLTRIHEHVTDRS
eukprot:COSAG01_NODE_41928_length_445_cov_2.450867_1_plen_106_part_10